VARPLGLVGIMSTRRPGSFPFAEGGYFRQLMRAGRRAGVYVIAFSPLDIDWSTGTVLGFTYRKGVGWRGRSYPVPRIVYDRLYPSRGMWNLYWSQVRRMRRTYRVTFMGRGLHGKWQMYRIVRRYEDLRPYLPETRLCSSVGVVIRMLEKYPVVYVKPIYGSGGKGILRISRSPQGGYYVVGNTATRRFRTRTRSLLPILAGINRRYLVQQGLKLNYLNGSTFDIRCIVQRNGEGQWQVSGKAARIGRRGSITSNLHTGGGGRTVSSVLQEWFPDRAEELEEEIDRVALRTAEVMNRHAGPLCDLGLDLGVDVDGKVWLIEVNSKPGRRVFLYTRDREARYRTIQTLMDYARFLVERRRARR
jgi:glutathione synthase/RimK-type ligase-like ATP-grasp enzyme